MYPGTVRRVPVPQGAPCDAKAIGRRAKVRRSTEGEPSRRASQRRRRGSQTGRPARLESQPALEKKPSHEDKKRADAETRKRVREAQARRTQLEQLEARIAECEAAMREIERQMATAGFYEDHAIAQPIVDRHQALMWQLGDLMHQWENLQSAADVAAKA